MLREMLLLSLIGVTMSVGEEKDSQRYQPGTITGWSKTPKHVSVITGTGDVAVTKSKKFYELHGNGMKYELNDCGSFQPNQPVQYRVSSDKLYILRENAKEYKCRIVGAAADQSSRP